ncbi:MAG TPA: hypothetical protein VML55_01005 [Planctomycetaceae bacterium]|nr:hypothetical protein [Planctomycetaceae bacterium]
MTSITLGVIAAGIEASRLPSPEQFEPSDAATFSIDSFEDSPFLAPDEPLYASRPDPVWTSGPDPDDDAESLRVVRLLTMIAIPVFLVGVLACWLVWRWHGSPDSALRRALQVPGGRYSAAKLCFQQRTSKRARSESSETPHDAETI